MGVVDTRLHLGSGEHYTPGWFNVDVDPIWPTDLLCDANDLPGYCAAGTFTHLYLGHYLEHIPYGQIPAMMERVLTVCTPDVKIAVVGPCYELAKVHAPELLYNIADRGETSPGSHRWTATAAATRRILIQCGLHPRTVPVAEISKPEWPNPSDAKWQCAFLCSR